MVKVGGVKTLGTMNDETFSALCSSSTVVYSSTAVQQWGALYGAGCRYGAGEIGWHRLNIQYSRRLIH